MRFERQLLKNWTDESQNYSARIKKELASFRKQAWTDLILAQAGKPAPLDILDIGTGPGFFAIIMSLAGNRVSAVDYTEAMIQVARANAAEAGASAEFSVADGHGLAFPDDGFDLVINRNVAWTLMDAAKAFAEWRRVLRPGGRAIIFDANWNFHLFDEEQKRRRDADRAAYAAAFGEQAPEHTPEMVEFRRSMPMCRRKRPQWDLAALVDAGFARIFCDTNINERVYEEKDKIINKSTPMFMLVAEK
jgi:SAM-dependent methyltransferase